MTFHIKTLFGSKPLSIRVYEGIRYLVYYLVLKNMILFMIKLDMLLVKKWYYTYYFS